MSTLASPNLATEQVYTVADLVSEFGSFQDRISSTDLSALVPEARALLSKGFQLADGYHDDQMRVDVFEGLKPWLGDCRVYVSRFGFTTRGHEIGDKTKFRSASLGWIYDHACPDCSEEREESICLKWEKISKAQALKFQAEALYPNVVERKVKHTQIG
jgi:hypothetical protein